MFSGITNDVNIDTNNVTDNDNEVLGPGEWQRKRKQPCSTQLVSLAF